MRADMESAEVEAVLESMKEPLEKRFLGIAKRKTKILDPKQRLVNAWYRAGLLKEAEPLYLEVKDVKRILLGERHPDTLTSISNLGTLFEAKGDVEAAREKTAAAQERQVPSAESQEVEVAGLFMQE